MNPQADPSRKARQSLAFNLRRYALLYLMIFPTLAYLLLLHYLPIYGVVIAFQRYRPHLGIAGMLGKATWVGLRNFEQFFRSYYFARLMINTLRISLLKILFGFPMPILLALMLHEIRCKWFQKLAQTISYLPHFLSWVILSGLLTAMLSPANGAVNQVIAALGGQPVSFLTNNRTFVPVLVVSAVWQSVGWGSIIYLATLAGVDPQLYESAIIDGATRLQQACHISLPAMYGLMSIQLIMTMGGILSAGFDQVLMLYSPLVYETGDIIDTFVYRTGIEESNYSYSTAVGLFKSVIGFCLMMATNRLAGLLGRETLL